MKLIEYAFLSEHVYETSHSLFGRDVSQATLLKNNILQTHKDGWYIITDVDDHLNPSHSNFYAALYIKYVLGEARHAVVAYRGTKTLANKIADALAWQSDIFINGLFDTQPPYALQASGFFRKAKNYVQKYFPNASITLTGHSLGGALAQWVVGVRAQPFFATTFNAPGIGHMSGVHDNLKHWVTNINSRYGFINKVGKSFGEVNYVDVTEQQTTAEKAWHEIAEYESLDEQMQTKTIALSDIRLFDKIAFNEMMARNDVLASWLPQHKLSNLIQAIG